MIEAAGPDVLSASDGRDCFLGTDPAGAHHSNAPLRRIGISPGGPKPGEDCESLVRSIDDDAKLDQCVEAVAAKSLRRKGISESELLDVFAQVLQAPQGSGIWDAVRGWMESGYIDALMPRRWRGRIYFARRPRLVVVDGDPEHSSRQLYYSGWVKPSEVWHDASLFRMVRQVEAELAQEGSRVQRVILDDELKGAAYRAVHEARSDGEPDRYARLAVAQSQGLHVDGDRFVFPDVRLDVQDRDGTVRTVDLELVTKDYHRGHLSGKAGAGFRMFGGGSGGSRGGTPQDPRHVERLIR
jgi:hypothetical protein